jgi:glycosyltransferase involved in cell wall biosynthesis
MTVFNAEPYLAASIESIQQQTFQDWEFIIVDDASTDHSLAIATSYAAKDRRISVVSNVANKGQTRCLNQGLALARASWIARQDADDLSHRDRFKKQWQQIEQEPDLALLGTCGLLIDQAGKLIGLLDTALRAEVLRWSAAITNPFLHTSVMFRTDVVRSLGGYDEHYRIAQDYDLWTRIMCHHRAANLPQRLVSYRHLASSLSKSGASKMFEEAAHIAQREEKSSFGRELKPQERLLVTAFREGGEAKQQAAFFQLFNHLKNSLYAPSGAINNDQKRLEVIYHLQSAGSKSQHRHGQLREMTKAFLILPLYTLRWLLSRFF